MYQNMVIATPKSNLGTWCDYSVVYLHETESQQFYISDLKQQAIAGITSNFKLI